MKAQLRKRRRRRGSFLRLGRWDCCGFFFFLLSDRTCLPPRPPLPPSLWLLEATAGRLLPLRLDVVVYLELGLVGLLRRSVLQLPGGDRETEGVTADAGGGGRVGCSTGWVNELHEQTERERDRKEPSNLYEISSESLGLESFSLIALKKAVR